MRRVSLHTKILTLHMVAQAPPGVTPKHTAKNSSYYCGLCTSLPNDNKRKRKHIQTLFSVAQFTSLYFLPTVLPISQFPPILPTLRQIFLYPPPSISLSSLLCPLFPSFPLFSSSLPLPPLFPPFSPEEIYCISLYNAIFKCVTMIGSYKATRN